LLNLKPTIAMGIVASSFHHAERVGPTSLPYP
jgi:hypothetical protein